MNDSKQIIIPEHSKPHWKSNEWIGDCHIKYVSSFFHSVKEYIGMHFNDFYELNIVTDGHGLYSYNGSIYKVSPGSIIVVPPNISHGYYAESPLNVFHALIKPSFFEQYEFELYNMPGYTILFEIEPFLKNESKESQNIRLTKESFADIASLLHNLVKLEQNQYPGREVLKSSLLLYLIGLLSSSASSMVKYQKYNTTDNISINIVCSMEYIRKNFDQKLNIEDLAKKAMMSRSTFLRHFKRICGYTPIAFLNICRTTYAKKLLCYTKMLITEITQECGYFDSSHFIRTFSSIEGITPSEFRNLYAESNAYSLCSLCVKRA